MLSREEKRKNTEAKRAEKAKKIPQNTLYCYTSEGPCPYLKIRKDKNQQQNGSCRFLKASDWSKNKKSKTMLLWDSVKECGISEENNEADFEVIEDIQDYLNRNSS